MLKEWVNHPMGGRELKELEERPEELMLATVNQLGVDVSNILQRLGFVATERRNSDLILMLTPEKIMDRNWALLPQVGSNDPHLFTICLDWGEIGYTHLFRQIKQNDGSYSLFFI